jgi:hypothetical protein
MTFQTSIKAQQAPAVEGDFASANPRASVLAGEGAFVAGAAGATVGRFGWADASGLVTNVGAGVPSGFIHREMNALMSAGDFWAKSLTVATVGQKVFASNTDGTVKTGAAGATVAGYTETKWTVGSAGAANDLIKISTWA